MEQPEHKQQRDQQRQRRGQHHIPQLQEGLGDNIRRGHGNPFGAFPRPLAYSAAPVDDQQHHCQEAHAYCDALYTPKDISRRICLALC
jgi:hypothetical protein